MSENRVQFNTIVSNQLPAYVREDFPLVSEFLKQYYIGQEYQGGPVDLIQNIDKYIKVDNTTNLSESVVLASDIEFDDTTINVSPTESPRGTEGFPDSYGLLKIDDEVITYTGKTTYSFTGCKRGFVGITSYRSESKKEEVIFQNTAADDHESGATIENLSVLFLKEFLIKTKHQFLPGFENRTLTPELDQSLFIKQSKDFYLSKGTDRSFEILFNALYNEDVEVIKPREQLFTPSNAQYRVVNELVVEPIEGDPENLINATLFQEKYNELFEKAYAPITSIERVNVGYGKTFYRLGFDGGYSRDIRVEGSLYGEFSVEPSTRVIGQVSAGSTVLDVDSTIGFGNTGELYVTYSDLTSGVLEYTSKSSTQFFGVSNVEKTILDSETVGINTFAYAKSFENQDETIRVRINSVLNDFNIPEKTRGFKKGEVINVTSLGISEKNLKTKNWFYNVAPIYKVSSISLIDSSNFTYTVSLNVTNSFKPGDNATLDISDGTKKQTKIINVTGEKTFTIRGQGQLNTDATFKIQRNIKKVESNSFPTAKIYSSDVQNVYKSKTGSDYLVASSSIPNYDSQPLNASNREVLFSGTFSGTEFLISPGVEHGLYTGDKVYYAAQLVEESFVNDSGTLSKRLVRDTGLFGDGEYFVQRVDGFTVKFAKSRNDIANSKFINVETSTTVNNSKLCPASLYNKSVESQNILRKISIPSDDGLVNETKPGFTGILVNGVEILNYKSEDLIRYGKINDIEVLAGGVNVDVVNPPELIISDSVGTGATGYVSVSGSLEEIRIIDPGFDYQGTPTIKIDGGNGQGASASINMKKIDHQPEFFADLASGNLIIGTGATESTIGFATYHKFKNAEAVIYQTKDQNGISGIVTNSQYFVSVVDNTRVRLHPKQEDAISGINTVYLTDYGVGKHSLRSVQRKSVIQSITVNDSGDGYENKKRTAPAATGISTSNNSINIVNHNYQSGEIVKYTCEGTPVSGLAVDTEYYVTKESDNSFKLSQVGVSSDKQLFYRTKQYVDLTSVGVGTHIFNYPDITVSIVGKIGISSIAGNTFEAQVQPIFRGSVTSVHLENQGVGYGSSEIINLDKQPQVTLNAGSDCQLRPVVSDGKIVQVIVLTAGSGYVSTPDILINGDGVGAVVTPNIVNGSITSVNIIESGGGYSQNTTTIDVIPSGSTLVLPEFKTNLQTWRVNLFEKYFSYIKEDDGFVTIPNALDNGLQYAHIYAPRKLRETVFAIDQDGNTLFGERDLKKVNSIEQSSDQHSPILGFAYDGNPIYGPYGYSQRSGGAINQMKSGYRLDIKTNRPPTSIFPEGFFVEDYTHYSVTDDSTLDENNGRFCITPEYPNGTYAYFMTVNDQSADNSGVFEKYRRPVFPYIIGQNYHSIPEEFNLKYNSVQENLDSENWRRNTEPYNLIEDELEYPYVFVPSKLKQKGSIISVSPGVVESIGISSGGQDYRMGDAVVFDNTGTSGEGLSAKVTRLKGREVNSISVATSSISNVEIYPGKVSGEYVLFSDNPHNFLNLDIVSVSGLSTTSSKIEGEYKVGIQTNRLTIVGTGSTGVAIGTDGVTGLVTFFKVSGDLSYPNVRENDILSVGDEKIKVLNVDSLNSRIRVLRAVEGTSSGLHTIGKFIFEDPRKLTINSGFKTDYAYRRNEQIYFNPEVIALGTNSGVGIGTTITFSNPGSGITSLFIPTKSIFIKNHNLKTGDELTYSPNGGDGIIVQDETNVGVGTTLADGQKVFVAKIDDNLIGIATVRVGLGTTGSFVGIASTNRASSTLFFRSVGTGNTHSFKTNFTVLTGSISRNEVTVSTAETHGLSSPHNIFISVSPDDTITKTVKYNDFNRKLVVNPIGFATAGVNTSTNAIEITSHGFKSGDKVIHTSSSSSGGLQNEKIYYVVRVDDNNIKLSNTFFDATKEKPEIVNITSSSLGTINPINPSLVVYKNSTFVFDLSDASLAYTKQGTTYPAFDLNLYTDANFTKVWNKTVNSSSFELVKEGKVGTSGAKATLTVNSNIPEVLFYKLDVLEESDVPVVKSEINIDDENVSHNKLEVRSSVYNGKHRITVGNTTSFTYTLAVAPEKSSYIGSTSTLTYDTDCTHTYGPISLIEIVNPGKNYYSLPGVTTVTTASGKNSILDTSSSTIGAIKKVEIDNTNNYFFPSDKTLSPSILFAQILSVDRLASFGSVGFSSFGRGFSIPPKLVALDGRTNELITDVDFKTSIGKREVEILKNTNGINNVTPTIIATQTDSGVGISSIRYNSSNGDVDVTLSVGFSTVNSFPFSVGDKVLVENISVGVGSTGKGFNSENYNYKLFSITNVTENLGGIGSVRYNISDSLSGSEFPGTFDAANSTGRITAQKNFPLFDIVLETRDYIVGEEITSGSKVGIVNDWDPKIETLTVSSDDKFTSGDKIVGSTSKVESIASPALVYESNANLDSDVKVIKGWQNNSGFVNFNPQRVQDSFYYQNFSYSLKSKVEYDKWEEPVSSTNHTLGFKKFSDYQLETKNENNMTVGLTTNLTNVTTIYDLDGFASLHCVFDFDLVTENNLNLNSKLVSDEILFSNRVLQDYFESVGNRVLSIDDLSPQFNSNPRATAFSTVNTFDISEIRSQKYITYVRDKRFSGQRQLMIVDLLHDGSEGYLNQYGRIETQYDQGSFDFSIAGTEGQLLFYPTKFTVNDYDVTSVSYNLNDVFAGVGTTSLGGVALVETTSSPVTSGVTTTIVSIANTYTSAKILVQVNPDTSRNEEFETIELNIVHDGSNVEMLEYGRLTTNLGAFPSAGLGTYHPYIDGETLKVDFIPTAVGIATTGVINTIQVGLATNTSTGIGTMNLDYSKIEARTTSITASATPGITTVAEFNGDFDCAYFIVQVADTTNDRFQMSEVVVVEDFTTDSNPYETYMTEYGNIETVTGLGTIGSRVSAAGTMSLVFTPTASIDTVVNVYQNALCLTQNNTFTNTVDFTNGSIKNGFGDYTGTESDIKREFELKHENQQIFERYFEANDASIVDTTNNTIKIPNHFFVSGEKIRYIHVGNTDSAVGIATASFVGAPSTTFLPGENLYAVKVDDNNVKIATSAANALKSIPQVVELESVGIGTSHRFISTNQNAKVIVALDNIIQSPVVSTAVTTTLADQVVDIDNIVYFSGISSFFGADLIKIGSEIMKIEGVGIGSTNAIRVRRSWLGTRIAGYGTGDLVTKISGNYNIVDNHLNFAEAPFGQTPIGSTTNPPDERDWTGITTSSSFQGRSFIRSGITNTSDEAYHKNYIFDDVSDKFNATTNEFTLKQNGSDVTGISTENAIILVNDVFQTPGANNQYTLDESSGITSVTFQGTNTSPLGPDVGISSYPKGGIIVSVASSEGLGYQPLVAAGGTAIVSGLGTISSISIGNSGSGYRAGIQTVVNVGVALSATGTPSIEFIGTAAITNGNIVSVAITNPGTGYTTTNVPYVVFDEPLSYSNLSLEYTSDSVSGLGTEAKVNVVVGQGSSVIDFEITNTGYGYGNGEILTVPIGGLTGIPTTSDYKEFTLTIDEVFSDEFTGWSVGTLQVFDDVSDSIDGIRKDFTLSNGGSTVSIVAGKGSKVNVQDVILVFVNNILQVPGEGYTFNGGSIITFTEAPKVEDYIRILFYKGSGDTDVIFRNVIETVKKGDTLEIKHDSATQEPTFDEELRSVNIVKSTNIVGTNPYYGPGNTNDVTFERPVTWCRQTEDKIIDEIPVGKDRELYEPVINPSAYLIKSVGVGSTAVYVDNLRPLFDSQNENDTSLTFQKKVKFVRQESKSGAAATAIVSGLGTISSVVISDGGVGYTTATVSFGFSTSRALGSVTIGSAGTVTGVAITSPGAGYTNTNPPTVLISPPSYTDEEVDVSAYTGDNGIIVGFGTTSVGVGTTSLIFDVHIPFDSFLRDSDIVGTAITISSLSVNDYFIVRNSNVGLGSTSVTSFDPDGNTVGVGTSFADNVYSVRSAVSISTSVQGITTHVRRLTVDVDQFDYSLSGITTSDFFGNYSFGKIDIVARTKENSYTSYTTNGIGITNGSGISTSPMIVRSNFLKFKNYIV